MVKNIKYDRSQLFNCKQTEMEHTENSWNYSSIKPFKSMMNLTTKTLQTTEIKH